MTKRKTLKDDLLNGRAAGRYYQRKDEMKSGLGIYKFLDLKTGRMYGEIEDKTLIVHENYFLDGRRHPSGDAGAYLLHERLNDSRISFRPNE